jgi:branched-chain amino acid transport system substrate-binding protein
MPYSGPASAYGTIGRAEKAYFDRVNGKGGIHGRRVRFISLDDAYSPPKTVEQARRLVEHEGVLLIFNPLGTAGNTAIHEYMNAKKVPQLFVASGASKWGQPEKYPWTMGWQPSYATEGAVIARYILEHLPKAKVAVLYQNDDYGADFVGGLKRGLGPAVSKMIVAQASYEVSAPTVDSQIATLKNSGADVFVDVTTPKFAAQAIRRAYDIGWRPVHFLNSVSASIDAVLKPAGFEKATGVLTAIYNRDPTDPAWKATPEYKDWAAWMDKYYPEGDKGDGFNVYAYNVAFTLVHVLNKCGDDLTRENVMRQAASMEDVEVPMLLPGIKLNTSPVDFYPIEQEQLARFDGTNWERFGRLISVVSHAWPAETRAK